MGSNLVIVALPAADEPVWKVSSEQVPHLTILFLGENTENTNTDRILQFVNHAITTNQHGSFYLDVDYRDTLGPDDADVLFFRKDWSAKWITQLRGQLLQNEDIRSAYESVEQYDEPWVPHLTLGYPKAPAHDDKMPEHGIYGVRFDRIAVWTDNYDGPSFRLQWPDWESDMCVAYSGVGRSAVTDILEHHGVKGQKWGVRKNIQGKPADAFALSYLGPLANVSPEFRAHASGRTKVLTSVFGVFALLDPKVHSDLLEASKQAQITVADKQLAKGLKDGTAFVAVHNASAEHFNSKIDGLNSKWDKTLPNRDWSKEDWEHPKDPDFKKYMADVDQLSRESLQKAVDGMHLENASGTQKVEVVPTDAAGSFTLKVVQIKHDATSPELTIKLIYKRDDTGAITGFDIDDGQPKTAVHGAAFVDGLLDQDEDKTAAFGAVFVDGLMHHGIKGQKWGVRKEEVRSGLHNRRVSVETQRRDKRPAQDVRVYDTIGVSKSKKSSIDTKGGEDHAPAPDAIKVAVVRQKLKKSGPAALSNQELRDVATRLQLEAQVAQLEGKTRQSAGKKFISQHLKNNPKNQQKIFDFGTKAVTKTVAKKVATGGLA